MAKFKHSHGTAREQLPDSLGAKTADESVSVVFATDGDPIPVTSSGGGGLDYAGSVRHDYSVTPVTTGAWQQLIASTAADFNVLFIFDSSGSALELGTGASGFETRVLVVPPGGIDGQVPLYIPAGTRLSIRALSANANAGEHIITGLT